MDETRRYYTRPRWRHVFDWLDEVRRRPAMFIRDGSLRELESLVHGYLTAQDVHGIDEGVPSLGRHFGTWLRLKTGWSLSAGWAYAIETNSTDPLERFFAFTDSYRNLKPVPLARAALEPRHLPTGRRVVVGYDRLMPPPAHIDVVEYQPESLFFLRHRYEDGVEEGDIVLSGGLHAGTIEDAKQRAADEFRIEHELWRVLPRA